MIQAHLSSPSPAAPRASRRLIAVASGKGGVGKTWLSITLSHALTRLDKRVLLFDGDLGLANVDVQLGISPEHDLGGVLGGRHGLAAAATSCKDAGFSVITGRSGSGSLAAMPADRLRQLGDELLEIAPAYDRLVLDLGAGIDRTVRHLARLAGTCLVVTTDEPTALTDAYAFIKVAVSEKTRRNLQVVVNLASSTAEAERTYTTLRKACENFLKISPPLAGIIHRDAQVKEAIRAQSPLLTRFPGTQAARDVEALAAQLLG